MKKLINDPRHVVREMLEGIVDISPALALLEDENVVVRADLPEQAARPVAVLSGGGSGHEPAHAGYVGDGLLTGAIAGDVFTSPSSDAVLSAIRATSGPAGAVLIVKNYTGDRLNFGLAAELARTEGIPVEIVVVADDVALRDVVEPARRRGLAGTVLIHKIAGAAARKGHSVQEVASIAREASAALGTMGVALGACTLPGASKPGFTLPENEVELGLGIHGEQGVSRSPLSSADELTETLIATLADDLGLKDGARIALLVNGLGATTPLELAIVGRAALAALRQRRLQVERVWSGNYLTALDMPGCSLSLLRLDDERLALLDAPATSPAWQPGIAVQPARKLVSAAPLAATEEPADIGAAPASDLVRAALQAVATAMRNAEPELTDLDSRTGDGDLGASMVRGAEAIETLPRNASQSAGSLLAALGNALRRAIAGSSGPFYAVALMRTGRRLDEARNPGARDWAEAFEMAVASVGELGGAKPGDRTMLDALHPAADALLHGLDAGLSPRKALSKAVQACAEGVDATTRMHPRLGRAAYLGERAIGSPDAGAAAVLVWMRALEKAVTRS
ncbi:homodimeric dihydroxyacetone kinase [Faunimonas pinastri]|uniref:Homodimeric dihydroxyacetone kinase n=1 Tax=Faunimonas pinastri TaxID=1855383 RepID=A0A1H9EEJ7_9HYPH|nr:dihydroxyacetone kinase family protein [Faunimonas pinastri]SEQ23987.1 homodimeric dihydroxyacetone kinase [Faunimonas pinastri]